MEIGNLTDDMFSASSYFPTMIFSITCDEHVALNQYLLDQIYAERERDQKGIERSNFPKLGGWHSHNNLHQEQAYNPLTDRIHQAGQRISLQLGYHPGKKLKVGTMWSIINAPGSSDKSHIHPGCHWSGVYYVHAPESAGDIEFTDPRTSHVMNQPKFEPKNNAVKRVGLKYDIHRRLEKCLSFRAGFTTEWSQIFQTRKGAMVIVLL
jgi:uncharacterized protein (TIGR02466 family)